jgi:hypothetical protein
MQVSNHPFAPKLTVERAEEIRRRYRDGESPSLLAAHYGIARSSLYAVVRGRSHRPRVSVVVSSAEVGKLDSIAAACGTTRDEVASRLLRRALDDSP